MSEQGDRTSEGSSLQGAPYIGHKLGDKRLAHGRSILAPGEQLWAAVLTNSLKPMLDIVLITNLRILAGYSSDLGRKGPAVEILGNRVASSTISGFATSLKVTDRQGAVIGFGQLQKKQDHEAVRSLVDRLASNPPSGEELQALTASAPGALEQVGFAAAAGGVNVQPLAQAVAGAVVAVSAGAVADVVPADWPDKALSARPKVALHLAAAERFAAVGDHAAAEVELDAALGCKVQVPMLARGKFEDALEREIESKRAMGVLADPVEWRLARAEACAATGDIRGEEKAIWSARAQADKGGLGSKRKARKHVDVQIADRVKAKTLRLGAAGLGRIEASQQHPVPEGLGLFADQGFRPLEVFSDRVVYGGEAHPLDGRLMISLEVDGQVVTSSRPTMTRMAAGAVLPGTALIPGLAFQKKKTTDTRSAQLLLSHPDWSITVPIDPDRIGQVRPLVAKLDSVVREMERRETSAPPEGQPPGTEGKLSQLERVAALQAAGSITAEEASMLRSQILAD